MALLSPIMWGVPENVDRGKPLNISTNVTWSLFSTFPLFYPLLLSLPPPVTGSPSLPAVGSWKIKVLWVAKQWGMLSLASVYHPSWCSIYKRAISTTHTCLSVLQDSHKIGKLFHLKSTASISPSPFRNDVSLWLICGDIVVKCQCLTMSTMIGVLKWANLILKTLAPFLFFQKTFFQHCWLGSQFCILSGKLLS